VSNPTPNQPASPRWNARLKTIGLAVLLIGLAGAGILYWTGSQKQSDDLSQLGFSRPERRQMGLLYGRMGSMVEDWEQELKQPGTQAAVIAGVSIAIAAGCFYFARLMGNDD